MSKQALNEPQLIVSDFALLVFFALIKNDLSMIASVH